MTVPDVLGSDNNELLCPLEGKEWEIKMLNWNIIYVNKYFK